MSIVIYQNGFCDTNNMGNCNSKLSCVGTVEDTNQWYNDMATILNSIHTKWILNEPPITKLEKKHNLSKYFAEHFIEMFYSADPDHEFKQPYVKNPDMSCLNYLSVLTDYERMIDWIDNEFDHMDLFDREHVGYDQFKQSVIDSIDWRAFVVIVYHEFETWLSDNQNKLDEFIEKRDDIIAEINTVKQQIKTN